MTAWARRAATTIAIGMAATACGGGRDDAAPTTGTTTSTTTSTATTSTATTSTTTSTATVTTKTATTRAASLARVRAKLTQIAALQQPLALAVRAGDTTLYVAEKTGRVRTTAGAVVLDLSGEVTTGGEQGLLGLAFAPDGAHVYVDYTDRFGDTRVAEYAMVGATADAGSRRELLSVRQPYANHNGGGLAFGPDGFLYISLGDGGSANDPQGNAQNLDTLLGKLLRIDPHPSGSSPYTIPAGNPFTRRNGARAEIWDYGLRNPWRFSFDRTTGDLWIGDVGQNAWEEVDREQRGAGGHNYGWDRLEGTHRVEGDPPAGAVAPVIEYGHGNGECAVTGGYQYRGTRLPGLAGAYLYADFCVGRVRAAVLDGTRIVTQRDLGVRTDQLASFGEDAAGELYVLSLSGGVYRIDPA